MHEGTAEVEDRDPQFPDLRATARRALEFERGFLRQRWATYYAAWACAVIAYFVLPSILSLTRFAALSSSAQLLILAGIDLVLTATALSALVLLWGLARRANVLRSAVDPRWSLTGPRNLLRFTIVLALVAGALALSTRSAFDSYLFGDTTLLVLALLLLLHLHRAFHPVPPEGWLALGAFVAAVGLSFTSLLVFDSTLGHRVAWTAGALIWLGCAVYARFGVRDPAEGP